MYTDNLGFSQVMEHLPTHTFRRCVQRYHGNHKIKSFTCLDQFRCMAFVQLTIAKACAIWKRACMPSRTSFTTWVYAVASHATPWPSGVFRVFFTKTRTAGCRRAQTWMRCCPCIQNLRRTLTHVTVVLNRASRIDYNRALGISISLKQHNRHTLTSGRSLFSTSTQAPPLPYSQFEELCLHCPDQAVCQVVSGLFSGV